MINNSTNISQAKKTTSHLNSLNTKKTMAYGIGNISPDMGNISPGIGNISPGMGNISPGMGNISPGMENTQKCSRNKPVNIIPKLPC